MPRGPIRETFKLHDRCRAGGGVRGAGTVATACFLEGTATNERKEGALRALEIK